MQVAELQASNSPFRTLLDRSPSSKEVDFMNSQSAMTSLSSTNSPSPADIQMNSLDSEESDNSNPELENALESYISEEIQCKITKILEEVQQLSDTEKLLLYLRLPGETCSELKDEYEQNQALPISTTRAEQTQAFHWIRCHLEECDNNSTLPKHEVYDEYKAYCESMNAARTLSAPDFGKIIKCVFPRVKARRLGTRGNSKYCYSGIQRKKNVKPPTLPSLQIPSPSDKEKNNTNQGNGMNGGEKIEEDQTLSAACLLVCEWANKLLGRVFTTLIELARFLVGGSYVSSKSMAAFVVMSNTDNVSHPQLNHIANSLFSPQKHENQIILTPKRKQLQQPFQKKVVPNQRQQKQQQLTHAILTDGSGNQILPKTPVQIQPQQQSPLHKQQIHLQSKPPTGSTGNLQFYQQATGNAHLQGGTNGSQTSYQKMRPPTPSLMSPNGPNQVLPETPSPFQASPKFSAPGTPQRPMTPSSGVNQSRHSSNAIEPTRFLFTPIPNNQKAEKGDTSPPTLRPTATHPQNQDWQSGGPQQAQVNLNEVPMSPSKQPRLSQCAPATPTRRPSSFPYPLSSPRTPQRVTSQQYVTSPPMMSPNTSRAMMSAQSPSIQQKGQELVMMQGQDGLGGMVQDAMNGMRRGSDSSPTVQITEQMIKQGCGPDPSRTCRYSTSSDNSTMPPTPLSQQQSFDYSSELDSICNTTVTNAGQVIPQFQRSQSVPPLPQHTLLDKRFHPLTPQTDNRVQQMTPSPMETTNSNQHLNGLKELRNRVLHGDVNNNGSRTNENAVFTARRNLTSLLNADQGLNTNASHQSLWNPEAFQTGQTGSSSSEEQEMEMLESNLNFSDLTSDGEASLPDLNTFDEATAEVVLRNICNNTSGVWPTSDVGSWNTQQPLQIMD